MLAFSNRLLDLFNYEKIKHTKATFLGLYGNLMNGTAKYRVAMATVLGSVNYSILAFPHLLLRSSPNLFL